MGLFGLMYVEKNISFPKSTLTLDRTMRMNFTYMVVPTNNMSKKYLPHFNCGLTTLKQLHGVW